MSLPRSIEIDGRRYVWRDLVALRCAHAKPLAEQPTCSRGAAIAARLAAQRGRAIPRAEPVHPAGGAAWLTASTAVAGAVPRRLVWPVAPYHFIEISKP